VHITPWLFCLPFHYTVPFSGLYLSHMVQEHHAFLVWTHSLHTHLGLLGRDPYTADPSAGL
jgi:hypothetical protein